LKTSRRRGGNKIKMNNKPNLRSNITIEGIPIVWNTNLSDDEIKEFYLLISDDPELMLSEINTRANKISLSLFSRTIPFKDGMCLCVGFNDNLNVIYRTFDDWEQCEIQQEKNREAEEEFNAKKTARIALFELENDTLINQIKACITNSNFDAIKPLINNLLVLREDNLDIKRALLCKWDLNFPLISLFAKSLNIDSGVYLLEMNSCQISDYIHFAQLVYVPLILSEDRNAYLYCDKIFLSAIKKFNKNSRIYKEICLFWWRHIELKLSLKYCEQALLSNLSISDIVKFNRRKKRILNEMAYRATKK
jgi:hypothetical protein